MGEMADYYRELELEDHMNGPFGFKQKVRSNPILNKKTPVIPVHISKDGKTHCIRLSDATRCKYPVMSDSHLINTIRYIKRRTKNGLDLVHLIDFGLSWDDCDFFEDHLTQKEARKYLNLKTYKAEARRRNLSWKKEKPAFVL